MGSDNDYGFANLTLNDDDEFNIKKNEYLLSITLSESSIISFERETRNQANKEKWFKGERRKRLTDSNFGKICNMRPSTSCKDTVYAIMYSTTKAIEYDKSPKEKALMILETIIEKPIIKCGIFVDKVVPYLAATPDGLVGEDAICSVINYKSQEEVVKDKKLTLLYVNNMDFTLKITSHYYYQIQGQLHISGRNMCYFFIYTPKWTHREEIYYNDEFWTSEMEAHLKLFYEECLLREIIDPQYIKRRSKSDIIEPPHILNNMKTK